MHARILALAALLALPGAALATDLNYNYLEVDYVTVDIDDFDEDFDGWAVSGSFLLAEQVYMFGGYSDISTDNIGGFKLSGEGLSLGVGYRYELSRQTDLNFAGAFERAKARISYSGFGSESETENGYSLAVGVRHLVSPQFELGVGAVYVDIGDADDTSAVANALWHLTELVAVGVSLSLGSDSTGYAGGVRFKF
jgi:opacity protein-like surface antigen